MRRFFHKEWVRALAVALAALTTTWAVAAAWDRYEVARMTEEMKTVCVGRMLIDLPKEAQTHLHGVSVDGFDIQAFAESRAAFAARLVAREAEIRAKPDRLGGNKNMESVREAETTSGLAGTIFVHSRNVTEGKSSDGLTFEHYRYEGIDLEAHLHSAGISIDVTAKDYDPAHIDNLRKLVSQLVVNPGNRIPAEPAFCAGLAYVREPLTADQGEGIVMSARLPSRPDIDIRLHTTAGVEPESKGLLQRNAESHARAPSVLNLRFTTLRSSPRTVGGLAGEELAECVVENNLAIVYGFEWEVNGSKDNVLVPDVTLRMATGRSRHGPVQSSLTQPAVLALWDKILSSIRVRPAAPHGTG
jgi:hypothetical protein